MTLRGYSLTHQRTLGPHVLDLDEIATKEEVEDAVNRHLAAGRSCDKIAMATIRETGKRRQITTFKASETSAEILKGTKRIRIGLTKCRIKEEMEVSKCYKCWDYGHNESKCKGADRKDQC